MSAEIIYFRKRTRSQTKLTTTAKNLRLRRERFEVWRRKEAAVDYWKTWLEFQLVVKIAASNGVQEAYSDVHKFNNKSRTAALNCYRAGLCELLLAPAPDVLFAKTNIRLTPVFMFPVYRSNASIRSLRMMWRF